MCRLLGAYVPATQVKRLYHLTLTDQQPITNRQMMFTGQISDLQISTFSFVTCPNSYQSCQALQRKHSDIFWFELTYDSWITTRKRLHER